MVGILCEKSTAAAHFATALGGQTGTYNGERYAIVNASGHLYEFAMPEEQVPQGMADRYKSWDVRNLPWAEENFSWSYKRKKNASEHLKRIRQVLSVCDEVVIAGDIDPSGEGSLLCWEIVTELKIKPKKWSRMYFVDEQPKSIQKAFVQRKPLNGKLDDPDYLKAIFRAQWDFLSMQFTRIASSCGDGHSTLRQGRLKSSMVLIVGEQLSKVAAYKKVPFYENRFKDENGIVYTSPDEKQYPNRESVPNVYKMSDVVCDEVQHKTQAPPMLLDLSSLSARLSSVARPKEVINTVQLLYENSILSYPRTEDRTITPEQFNELLPLVDKIAAVVGVDTKWLTHRQPRSSHVQPKGSHGANRPGPKVPNSLADLTVYGECAPIIYETLAKNYLAMLAEDYEYDVQKGHVKDYPSFTGQAHLPKSLGYKRVFTVDDDDEVDVDEKGLGKKAAPFVHEGFPPKPAAPTWKWLNNQITKRGIGTGATRTSTYAEITSSSSKYPLLKDTRGRITLTEFGEMSYRLLPGTYIGDLELTSRVQQQMADVAAGKVKAEHYLAQVRDLVVHDLKVMQENSIKMRKELNIDMASKFEQKEKFTGTWNGREVSVNRTWSGHRFTDDEVARLLGGETIEISVEGKNGPYVAVGKLSDLEYNGRAYVGFERTGYGKSSSPQKAFAGHTFTEDERVLLERGVSVHLDNCISKKGSSFSCDVKWNKDTGELEVEFPKRPYPSRR